MALAEAPPVDRREREVEFQQDLGYALRDAIKVKPDFRSKRFETARLEYEVGEGRADIAVLESGGKPFLIIETKRKNGRVQKDIDPWNPKVIHQALRYAVLKGAPYFATANRGYLAAFRTPERREEFSIPKHRVFATAIPAVTREFGTSLLVRLVDYELATTDRDRSELATALDWTFVYRLRSFVDWLYRRTQPAVNKRIAGSPDFERQVRELSGERGSPLSGDQLAREMVYVLVNKVVFYKALERKYDKLPRLRIPDTNDLQDILDYLSKAWKDATVVTEDFEAIFSTRLYDDISFDEANIDLLDLSEGLQGLIDDMEAYRLEDLEADVIGHVYEHLIPEAERHRLGKFYTPPAIAEFITRWAIRAGDDTVFDPAAGSGTFLVKAYQRLKVLKEAEGLKRSRYEIHRVLLSQLYSNDIDSFASHLTAMNLALRDVRNPVSEVNILETDFFDIAPASEPVTTSGERRLKFPPLDVVVGNPPYTRWTQLTKPQQKSIGRRLDKTLHDYGLVARVRGGVETALYHHFVIHATSFLKEGGRLGMIISNSWLQTDVGADFGRYLLDHFKVKAVVDFAPRVFTIPLVATTVILLEKCSDSEARRSNQAVLAMLTEPTSVEDLVAVVDRPGDFSSRERVRVIRQDRIPRDSKWLSVFFGFDRLDEKVRRTSVRVDDLFTVTKGTIGYCAAHKRGLGANSFFKLTTANVRQWGLTDYVARALPSGRYLHHFAFGLEDWNRIERGGQEAWLFDCRLPRVGVPKVVREYIAWGETECRNRDGDICSRAQSCVERGRKGLYVGWYDAGGVLPADILSTYYSQYAHRFALLRIEVAVDHDFVAFRAKSKMTELQKKAALACLNSIVGQLYVETQGRTTGGGMISMEAKHALNIPIANIIELPASDLKQLANAFDELEAKAAVSGVAKDRNAAEVLAEEYAKLDDVVASVLDLSSKEVAQMRELRNALADRRTQRAENPEVEAVRGEDSGQKGLRPPRKKSGIRSAIRTVRPLETF